MSTRWGPVCAALLLAGSAAAQPTEPFRVIELPAPGRTAQAGLADLDGDGLADVYLISLSGIPPRSRRELRVFFQRRGGTLPARPDWSGEVAADAGAFDVARLPGEPGQALLLLRRRGIEVLRFPDRAPARRQIEIPGDPTFAAAPDERGLDRLRLARPGLGPELRLLVPGLGECVVLTSGGEVLGRLDVGQRANYFIPKRPGPLVGESEIESYIDFPRLEVGDLDGDGRGDVIAASRHEVRVFRQRPDGRFGTDADLRVPIGRLDEKDLIRGSGNVRVAAPDLDGDGRVDLVVTSTTGGLSDARSETTFHLNRGGAWRLDRPDRRTVVERGWSSLQLVDLDGDGRPELLEARFAFSVLEAVETLLTREADIDVRVFRGADGAIFSEQPWIETRVHIGLDFDTFMPKGFLPSVDADVNGDGARDWLDSGKGERLEVRMVGPGHELDELAAQQAMDTRGSLRFGDLDGDGLTDLLLFARDRPDSPLRILVNRGLLPGTPRRAVISGPD